MILGVTVRTPRIGTVLVDEPTIPDQGRRMRLIINQVPAWRRQAGIGHYTEQLLRALAVVRTHEVFDGFPGPLVQHICQSAARILPQPKPSISPRTADPTDSQPPSRWRQRTADFIRQAGKTVLALHFRRVCRRGGYQVYHEPNFIPFPADIPTVATWHDLSVLVHPEWHPADRVRHYERHVPRTLAHCRHFLTDSEFSRQELIRHLGVRPERITCVHLGIREHLKPLPSDEVQNTLARLGLPSQYLLYVGTIEPRKNVLMLLRAYRGLPSDLRARWPLVLVGSWGWQAGAIADFLNGLGPDRGILRLGYVPEAHLAALYNGARALLYPSWYEGFGLPPLEMMACGGAVLASTAGALVETVGSKAQLLDPADEDGWRAAIQRVLTDSSWWQALRQGATGVARPYTWERCAAQTLRVYHQVADANRIVPQLASSRRQAG